MFCVLQCLNLYTFCVIHFYKGQSYYHYLLQIPFVICYIVFTHAVIPVNAFVEFLYFLYASSDCTLKIVHQN